MSDTPTDPFVAARDEAADKRRKQITDMIDDHKILPSDLGKVFKEGADFGRQWERERTANLIKALEAIKQHQSAMMVGDMNISTTYRIASEALAAHGGGGE